MTFRNKYLFIIFSVICLAGLIQQLIRYYNKQDVYESPKQLSGKKELIMVNFVERQCNCPMWMKARNDINDKNLSPDLFYLEPASFDLPTPEALSNRLDSGFVLKLDGEFYYGKGFPRYLSGVEPPPEKANIFHYSAFEFVNLK